MQNKRQCGVRRLEECFTEHDRKLIGDRPVNGAGAPRFGIRAALRDFAMAPFRIHHYRDVHSRMLRDALCTRDCGPGALKNLRD